MALALFAVISAGLTSAIIQAQRMAYRAVYENAAFNAAQGFLEQTRSMTYAEIENVFNNPTTATLPTISTSNGVSLIVDDPLTYHTTGGNYDPSGFDTKQVVIDINGTEEVLMNMRFYLELNNLLTNAPGGQTPWKAMEIELKYEYEVPSASGPVWREHKLVTVISEHQI